MISLCAHLLEKRLCFYGYAGVIVLFELTSEDAEYANRKSIFCWHSNSTSLNDIVKLIKNTLLLTSEVFLVAMLSSSVNFFSYA